MNAEYTLNKVKQHCLAISGDEQVWFNKDTHYHWNRGKTNYLITNWDFTSQFAATTSDRSITGGFLERESLCTNK